MNNVNSKTIETERLVIQTVEMGRHGYFLRVGAFAEVSKFFSIRDNQSKEDARPANMWQTATIRRHRQFTICLKAGTPGIPEAGGRMIGRIVLADIEDEWKAEIWRIYIADTALRGRGLGKEVMLAMMKYCFEELNLKRLYLDHYTGNPASFLYQTWVQV